MKEKIITRNKIYAMFLSLIFMGALLFVAGQANPIIEIEDEGLEEIVREKLDRPHGPIYETDLRTITELDASNKGINSLDGLERFTRLVNLNLAGNNINDVTPLVNLSMLRNLNLQNNGIKKLDDVNFQNITHLELRDLSLGDNVRDGQHLSDITLLQNLTTLEDLDLRNNQVEDLSPLENLRLLESLDLRNNDINDLQAVNFDKIVHLSLEKLNLSNNISDSDRLKNISLLQDVRTLENLNLRGNQIEDLRPLSFLNSLESLNLRDNRITDLEEVNFNEITHLPLKVLSLRHNVDDGERISDISLLEEMTLIEELELRDNHIEDLTPLANLQKIEILDLRENKFTDIQVLSELSNLSELNLRENTIDSIEPLTNLVNLKYLNLHTNDKINTLEPIKNLVSLETLIIRHIPIRNEKYIFNNLTNLQNLNALDTGIDRIETIEMFSKLRANGALQGNVRPVTLLHTVEPPIFSHSGGFYEDEFLLDFDNEVADGKVYYTLDGSDPTVGSYEYSPREKIILESQNEDDPVVVRAKVITNNNNISETITQTYFVRDDVLDRFSLPVISIATDENNLFSEETGIYTNENSNNRGNDWERPIHIEFYEKNGQLGFAQNLGVRIHGGISRGYSQKTLRLYADKEYDNDDTINYDVFKRSSINHRTNRIENVYDRLLLRNSGNDWAHTMFRDAMLQSLVEPLGTMDTQAYRPSTVFINGEYWGIHNIRERYDEYYLEKTYNIPKEDVVILQSYGVVDKGNADGEEHYNRMIEFIENNGLEEEKNYQYIQTLMDTENYRDYIIAQTFFGNTDWPHGNIRYWRRTVDEFEEDVPYGHDGRWRWMLFDTDHGFGIWPDTEDNRGNLRDYTHNSIDWVMTELDGRNDSRTWPNFLIRSMLSNQTFRDEFLSRYSDLLNSYFKSDVVINQIDNMQSVIEPEIDSHINRWGAISSTETWENNVERMRLYAMNRPDYITQHLINEFNLSGTFNLELDNSLNQNQGSVRVNSLKINGELLGYEESSNWSGEYFQGVPMVLSAIPNPGYEFLYWEGIEGNPSKESVEVTPINDLNVRPIFRKK